METNGGPDALSIHQTTALHVGQAPQDRPQVDQQVRLQDQAQVHRAAQEALTGLRLFLPSGTIRLNTVRWFCTQCEVWGVEKNCWICSSTATEAKAVPLCADGLSFPLLD